MPAQDDLLELIRALSPSEKRYFRLHADRYITDGYKSQYEKLYDALNYWTAEVYDEREFRRKHKGKTFLKNLPAEKSYLKSLLLKTLRNYHAETGGAAALHEQLLDIRLLISKGLKRQASSLIDRAMRLAEEQEQYSEIFLLNDFLLDLFNVDMDTHTTIAARIEEHERDILQRMAQTRQAIYLRTTIVEIHRQAAWDSRAAEADTIMQQAEALMQSPHLSKRAEISLLITQQHYLIRHHRYEEAMVLTGAWLGRIEAATHRYGYTPDQYRATLANYLLCLLQCEQFDRMPDVIARIRSLRATDERTAADCFRLAVQYELVYLLNKPGVSDTDSITGRIVEGLGRHRAFISESYLVQMRFNIALLHFLRRRYDAALGDIAELLHISGRDERYSYTTAMARAMEWMCHCSTGSYDILDSSLRNLKRYYADRGHKDPLMQAMWQLYASIIREGSRRPSLIAAGREQIAAIDAGPMWSQLKAIVVEWC